MRHNYPHLVPDNPFKRQALAHWKDPLDNTTNTHIAELQPVVDLVERYRVAIIDGDLDADEIEAMDLGDGLVVGLNGQPIVLWLRDERDDRAVVAWLGNDLDPDQDHLVEAKLDVTDGWRRLNSSTWRRVAIELAELAGDVTNEIGGELIVDELLDRKLLRRRGSAGEIVEIRRMTEASFDRIVRTALGLRTTDKC